VGLAEHRFLAAEELREERAGLVLLAEPLVGHREAVPRLECGRVVRGQFLAAGEGRDQKLLGLVVATSLERHVGEAGH